MTVKRDVSGKATSMPIGIGIGALTSFAVTLLGAAVLSYLIVSERISEASVGYGAMIVLFLSSALGAWLAAARIKHRRLMVCSLAGIGYYLLLLIVTVLCFGGEFSGMGISAIVIALGSMFAMLPFLQKKQGKSKYKIPAYR